MTQTIEQLTARVRELEEEKKELQALLDFDNARLDQIEDELEDVEYLGPFVEGIKVLKTKLVAAQAYAEQLLEALSSVEWEDFHFDRHGNGQQHCPGCGNQKSVGRHTIQCPIGKALALPHDTSALDAYVAEKVKEAMK